MSRPIETWRSFYGRAWWLVPEMIAVLALTVLLPVSSFGSRVDPLKAALADQMTSVLETEPLAAHHNHGHEVAEGETVVCVAQVYGFDPSGATTVTQVRTAYGYVFCAAGKAGTPYEMSSRMAAPAALDIGPPARIRVVASGLGYPDRVRELMPDRYEAVALQGFSDHDVPARLRPLYEQRVGAS